MRLGQVITEIGQALNTIDGINVYTYSALKIVPPAAIVAFPERIEFDIAMTRGGDRYTIPVIIAVAMQSGESAFINLEQYLDGRESSTTGVKTALENYAYTSCHSVRVTEATFDGLNIGGIDYLGAEFMVDILGEGN